MGEADRLKERIAAARGDIPVDLLLRGGTLVNVLSGELHPADVAIHDGVVVGLDGSRPAREEFDCRGRWIAPGFIDGHMHVESSLVTLPEFARATVPRGTVAAVLDPHEIANVHGLDGIRYILKSRKGLPLRAFVMASSCVPATAMETAGAELDAADLATLLGEDGVLGLAELMNFPGTVAADDAILAKVATAKRTGGVIDGHAPGLRGRRLDAYLVAGPGSDHECTTVDEAREKLRKGMRIFVREGSTARNLADLLPLITADNARRCSFVTDDRHPADLLREGHMDHAVRSAIRLGLDPVTAWRLASLNTAEWFGLDRAGYGAVAPGWRADVLLLSDLESVAVERVYAGGRLVARDGRITVPLPVAADDLPASVRLDPERLPSLRIPAAGRRLRVIELVPGQIVTGEAIEDAVLADGEAVADPGKDLLKLAVVERHGRSGGVGLGFVRGFGLRRGALASSVAHDAHNVVVCGVDDASMQRALREVATLGGGLVVAEGDTVHAALPLPIAGLMSEAPLEEVAAGVEGLHAAYRALGGRLDDPFMALSFLALAVIPRLKLTDRGLVDVDRFELVSLWTE